MFPFTPVIALLALHGADVPRTQYGMKTLEIAFHALTKHDPYVDFVSDDLKARLFFCGDVNHETGLPVYILVSSNGVSMIYAEILWTGETIDPQNIWYAIPGVEV